MLIVYYNTALSKPHGSGTHAKETFQELQLIDAIKVIAYPPSEDKNFEPRDEHRLHRPRFLIRAPTWISLGWKIFFKNYNHLLPDFSSLQDSPIVVFIRTNWRIRLLKSLRKQSEVALVCVEVNAIYSEETPQWLPFRRLWTKLEIKHLSHAHRIVVVSNYLKNKLTENGLDPRQILVNPNGVNPELFDPAKFNGSENVRSSWAVPENAFVFGYVGGMQAFRKLAMVVRAFGEFAKQNSDSYLVLIGNGSDSQEIDDIRASFPVEIQNRIVIVGVIPYAKVPLAMSAFNAAIFPFSNPYGSPQKIFEYLAMRLPVIGPKVPAVTDIFQDGIHLRLAEQDGSNLLELFQVLSEKSPQNEQMAQNGRDLVLSNYTWKANAQRIHEFLTQSLP